MGSVASREAAACSEASDGDEYHSAEEDVPGSDAALGYLNDSTGASLEALWQGRLQLADALEQQQQEVEALRAQRAQLQAHVAQMRTEGRAHPGRGESSGSVDSYASLPLSVAEEQPQHRKMDSAKEASRPAKSISRLGGALLYTSDYILFNISF